MLAVELGSVLRATARLLERVEQRQIFGLDETAHRDVGRNDASAAVALRQDRACLTDRRTLRACVEHAAPDASVDVAELDLEYELARLSAAAVDVLGDALAAPAVMGRFALHGELVPPRAGGPAVRAARAPFVRGRKGSRSGGNRNQPAAPLTLRAGNPTALEPLVHGRRRRPLELRVLLDREPARRELELGEPALERL